MKPSLKTTKKTISSKNHISIQQQLMYVHDAENDFKNSSFKLIGYIKHEFKFFLVFKFPTGRWSVGKWSEVGGQFVRSFKETLFFPISFVIFHPDSQYLVTIVAINHYPTLRLTKTSEVVFLVFEKSRVILHPQYHDWLSLRSTAYDCFS